MPAFPCLPPQFSLSPSLLAVSLFLLPPSTTPLSYTFPPSHPPPRSLPFTSLFLLQEVQGPGTITSFPRFDRHSINAWSIVHFSPCAKSDAFCFFMGLHRRIFKIKPLLHLLHVLRTSRHMFGQWSSRRVVRPKDSLCYLKETGCCVVSFCCRWVRSRVGILCVE